MLPRKDKGVSLTFAMIAATLSVMIIFSVTKIIQNSSRQMTYLEIMGDVYSLSESGLSRAIDTLIRDPLSCSGVNPTFRTNTPVTGGRYWIDCDRREIPVNNQLVSCYYITVVATRTVSGLDYSQKLHSYVEISNVSDYLFAINSRFDIAWNTKAPTGKIYAKQLFFNAQGGIYDNSFKKAEFYESLSPALNGPLGCVSNCTKWLPGTGTNILLAEPSANPYPVKIGAPLRFPIITPADAQTYLMLAGPHTTDTPFTSPHIFPPGYQGAKLFNDGYAGHTSNNEHHVYYSSTDLHIGIPSGSTVTIHGQVIFFTTNNIYINGNIEMATDTIFPGAGAAGYESSSTAHQAVFIAGPGKNIYITDNFCDSSLAVRQTLTLEGFYFATSGFVAAATVKGGPCLPTSQTLHFKGSIVAGSIGSPSGTNDTLAQMFNDTLGGHEPRIYEYMTTLQTNPPPYVPVFIVTYNEFQETLHSPSLYN